jgi:hypothetical protein
MRHPAVVDCPASLAPGRGIAGLIGFHGEKVDIFLDGERQPRPKTHFSDRAGKTCARMDAYA